MYACLDVDYRASHAIAACLEFASPRDAAASLAHTARITDVAEYVPGQFFKRELPCLLAVLAKVSSPLDAVLVDGHVWLRSDADPGLGAHLHEALGGAVPVIGVAKQAFRDGAIALPVLRGQSARPLYVTAAGIDPALAARLVAELHGAHRIPTLLREVDHLCRTA